jgi:hypothetical protein
MEFKTLDKHLEMIHEVMYDTPGNFYIKDLKGAYLYVNKNARKVAGINLEGKTDWQAPWDRYAEWYQECDKNAIRLNRCYQSRDLIKDCFQSIDPIVSHKKPFYHNKVLIGSSGVSLVIPNAQLANQTVYSDKVSFFDIVRRQELILSPRHRQILFWTLRGLSARVVAEKLTISNRTTEHHIKAIKEENGYESLKDILLQVRAL